MRRRLGLLGAWPVAAAHVEPSLVASPGVGPSERLLDIALAAVAETRSVRLDDLLERAQDDLVNLWPGEHYRLLTALVSCLQPKSVVEIGTATGMSALAMKKALPADGKLTTFDLLPWKGYSRGVLRDEDFADGRLEQRLDDLSTPAGWRANAALLRETELIFVDAKHDGAQERDFLRGFEEVGLDAGPVVVFDDTRVWGMLAFWQEIARPKLDLTSFGHWSGTGLVDYAKPGPPAHGTLG